MHKCRRTQNKKTQKNTHGAGKSVRQSDTLNAIMIHVFVMQKFLTLQAAAKLLFSSLGELAFKWARRKKNRMMEKCGPPEDTGGDRRNSGGGNYHWMRGVREPWEGGAGGAYTRDVGGTKGLHKTF